MHRRFDSTVRGITNLASGTPANQGERPDVSQQPGANLVIKFQWVALHGGLTANQSAPALPFIHGIQKFHGIGSNGKLS